MTAELSPLEQGKKFLEQLPGLLQEEMFAGQKIVQVKTRELTVTTLTPDNLNLLRATYLRNGETFDLTGTDERVNSLASQNSWDPKIFEE